MGLLCMPDIGVIGSADVISMFRILGIDVYPAENFVEAKEKLSGILEGEKNKIIFILESLAAGLREEIRAAEAVYGVTVVPLPDHASEINILDDELKRISRQAVGMEV